MSLESQFEKLTQGYDPEGEVLFDDQFVYRGVFSGFENRIQRLFDKIQNGGLFHYSIIETQIESDSPLYQKYPLVLKHKRLPFITYPHEWPAEAVRDSALMQIQLLIKLVQNGLVLKDCGTALNVVFDNANPIWVDFLSIVEDEELFEQEYLKIAQGTPLVAQLHKVMEIHFLPYTLFPLYYFASNQYKKGRERILATTLNTTTDKIRAEEVLAGHPLYAHHLKYQDVRLAALKSGNLTAYIRSYQDEILGIPVFVQKSNYSSYYKQKNEELSFYPCAEWGNKQNGVYNHIKKIEPKTVLDIGANTGWFSILAATHGAKVLAAEIDEACVNILHAKARDENLNIHACLLDFTTPTQDVFSRAGLESDVHNQRSQFAGDAPILMHLDKRAKSDMVMVLALVHHLCLGLGQRVEQLVQRLSSLAKKGMIIEFVAKEDPLIQGELSFFPAYNANRTGFDDYTQANWVAQLKKFFGVVEVQPSSAGRILLLCSEKVEPVKTEIQKSNQQASQPSSTMALRLSSGLRIQHKQSSEASNTTTNSVDPTLDTRKALSVSEYATATHPSFLPSLDHAHVIPSTFALGVTNACNLKCPLCVTGLREQTKAVKMMDLGLFKRVIDKIRPHAKLVQLYKWGESLMHKDIGEMLAYCDQFDLNTEISSNLSLKNDKAMEYLVKHRLKTLIVSFDGVTQEDYARYRKGGDLELVLSNIKKIAELKKQYNSPYPKITLQYLRNKFTTFQVAEIRKNFKAWGADDYVIYDMTMPFRSQSREKALEWFTPEEIDTRRFLDIDLYWQGRYCSFLKSYMIIEQDGSIPSCCYATDPKDNFGFWDDSRTIGELFTSKRRAEAMKMFETKVDNPSNSCSDCSAFKTWVNPALKGQAFKAQAFVSVVIEAKQGVSLEQTLAAWNEQNYAKDRFEVIVADLHQTAQTAQVIDLFAAKSGLNVTHLTLSQGVFDYEEIVKHARGEYFVFAWEGQLPQSSYLAQISQKLDSAPKLGFLASSAIHENGSPEENDVPVVLKREAFSARASEIQIFDGFENEHEQNLPFTILDTPQVIQNIEVVPSSSETPNLYELGFGLNQKYYQMIKEYENQGNWKVEMAELFDHLKVIEAWMSENNSSKS